MEFVYLRLTNIEDIISLSIVSKDIANRIQPIKFNLYLIHNLDKSLPLIRAWCTKYSCIRGYMVLTNYYEELRLASKQLNLQVIKYGVENYKSLITEIVVYNCVRDVILSLSIVERSEERRKREEGGGERRREERRRRKRVEDIIDILLVDEYNTRWLLEQYMQYSCEVGSLHLFKYFKSKYDFRMWLLDKSKPEIYYYASCHGNILVNVMKYVDSNTMKGINVDVSKGLQFAREGIKSRGDNPSIDNEVIRYLLDIESGTQYL